MFLLFFSFLLVVLSIFFPLFRGSFFFFLFLLEVVSWAWQLIFLTYVWHLVYVFRNMTEMETDVTLSCPLNVRTITLSFFRSDVWLITSVFDVDGPGSRLLESKCSSSVIVTDIYWWAASKYSTVNLSGQISVELKPVRLFHSCNFDIGFIEYFSKIQKSNFFLFTTFQK